MSTNSIAFRTRCGNFRTFSNDATARRFISPAHRVTLENLCFYYREDITAEMLREQFPTLPLVQIHKTIVFIWRTAQRRTNTWLVARRLATPTSHSGSNSRAAHQTSTNSVAACKSGNMLPEIIRHDPTILAGRESARSTLGRDERHNEFSSTPIDAVRVGDHGAPPLATLDPEILVWCEEAGRILVSLDKQSLPGHFGRPFWPQEGICLACF